MKIVTFLCSIAALAPFSCGPLPLSPSANPDRANVTIVTVNNQQPIEPYSVTAGDTVSLTLHRSLPEYIDSMSIAIVSTDNGSKATPYVDTRSDTAAVVFLNEGTGMCIVSAYISNGKKRDDTLIVTVAPKKENHRPDIKVDTLPFYSDKGTAKTCDLAEFVNDPDSDKITYTVTPAIIGFTLADSKLTASVHLDTGVYQCSLTVSDGILRDKAVLIWRVMPVADTFTNPDTSVVISDPKDTMALRFIDPETQIVVDESQLKTIKFTAKNGIGAPVTMSIIQKPSFVTGSISGSGITLTIAPAYATASSAVPEVDSAVMMAACCGADTVYHSVKIRVRNVNRPPEFTSFSSDTLHVARGSTFLSDPLSGIDPDNDAVLFKLVTDIKEITIGTNRKIEWHVPATGYTAGQIVTVVVRITDGMAFTDRNMVFVIE